MYTTSRYFTTIVLAAWVLCPGLAAAQSLSIIKKSASEFWIEASAPAGSRYVLQVSKNLQLWMDINDSVSGVVSNRVGAAGVTDRFFRLVPWTARAPVRIALLGDSTVADFAVNENHFYGWGAGMYPYFNADAGIVNLSAPGLGTKGFLVSEQKASLLALKPDYVLIDLFYIDAFSGPPETTTTLEEYETNLKLIVEMIREFNGIPILLTPQGLWFFDDTDQTRPAYPDRNAVVVKVAQDTGVYLIDLAGDSIAFLNGLGKMGSLYLFMDWLHFSESGASVMAGFVVNALPPSLGRYLVAQNVLSF